VLAAAQPGPTQLASQLGDRLLVVYDGVCGLCNAYIRWLIRRDRKDRLRFIPFQTPAVAALVAAGPQEPDRSGAPSSILVIREPFSTQSHVFLRSRAVLTALRELPKPWPAVATFLGLFPVFLADPVYRLIARWRYGIWGKLDSCPIPTPAERAHFL
jgi:predicted DCC family thiol-disulfide oxidoreductase YuxK